MIGLLKTEYTCLQILNFKQTRQLHHDNVDIENNQFYKIATQSSISSLLYVHFSSEDLHSIFLYQTKILIHATPTS